MDRRRRRSNSCNMPPPRTLIHVSGGGVVGVCPMKKLLTAMTAVSALALAAPAAAQYGYQSNNGYNNGYRYNTNAGGTVAFDTRISQLQTRLDAGISAGTIDRYEATNLRRQLDNLRRLEWRYSRNGLTLQERTDLQQRIRSVRQQLRTADNG